LARIRTTDIDERTPMLVRSITGSCCKEQGQKAPFGLEFHISCGLDSFRVGSNGSCSKLALVSYIIWTEVDIELACAPKRFRSHLCPWLRGALPPIATRTAVSIYLAMTERACVQGGYRVIVLAPVRPAPSIRPASAREREKRGRRFW